MPAEKFTILDIYISAPPRHFGFKRWVGLRSIGVPWSEVGAMEWVFKGLLYRDLRDNITLLYSVHHILALGHLAEHRMHAVEVWCGVVGDEELRAVGALAAELLACAGVVLA